MGDGAYIRIQNKSHHAVEIKVVQGSNVDETGMNKIQGKIKPGQQLPTQGETPYQDNRRYQYIEGDVRFCFQGDGYFHLEAHPTSGGPKSGLKLLVDSDEWWSEDPSPDADSPVLMVADVEKDGPDGRARIEIRIFDNYSGARWMGQLADSIADTPFNRVALPGTHDSGTYAFNDELGASPDNALTSTIDSIIGGFDMLADVVLKNIFTRLCQCQTLSFARQLQEGIRYFDMRIASHAETGTFHTCHGVYCVEMSDILKQFKKFLNNNPKVRLLALCLFSLCYSSNCLLCC
jgi:hypothetical protein